MSFTLSLDSLGLVAASLQKFRVPEIINCALGDKTATNSGVNYGTLASAMLLQLTDMPFQGLWGVQEYYIRRPVALLLDPKVQVEELNRYALARCLDKIHDFGPVRLYLMVAAYIAEVMGVNITELHCDSTSFHYDGETREELNCLLQAKMGYSRDHRPDINQFILLMLVEPEIGQPVFAKALSGNISDKTSFLEVCEKDAALIKKQFQELSYFIGDSASCTSKIFDALHEKKLFIVTRVPDNLAEAKACFAYADAHAKDFVELEHEQRNDAYSALWYPEGTLFGYPVKMLVVKNESLKHTKDKRFRRLASQEQEQLNKKLKKLWTRPAKCELDAQKNLDEIKATCKLTTIVVDDTVKNMGYSHRGHPKPGEQQVVKSVGIKAHAEINDTAVADLVRQSLKFVIATTDVKRDWSMYELKAAYSRQSLVERDWRISKNPKFFIDAFFLSKPSRINALLWLLSIAILVFVATGHMIDKVCRENNIEVPNPDLSSRKADTKLTFERVRQYFFNHHISIRVQDDLSIEVDNMTAVHKRIVEALGHDWSRMYDADYIKKTLSNHLVVKGPHI